jgi:GNAT superfamily N-acetyltransferase
MVEGIIVQPVEASRTYGLRQQVLRPNLKVEDMALFGDGGPDTGIFGAVDAATGEIVGTANVRREDPPPGLMESVAPHENRDTWRLRGMATREDLRGTGIGAAVLEACVEHVAARGGGFLWCNARVKARRFYARAGFAEWGDEFQSLDTAHIAMWRMVSPEGSQG